MAISILLGVDGMALQFEITTLEGLEENLAALYVAHGDVFRLSVDGLDDGAELKEALRKERELSKDSKARSKALEDANRVAEEARATEKGEYKTLWEREQEEKRGFQAQLEALKQTVSEKDRGILQAELIAEFTNDPARVTAWKGILQEFIKTDENGNANLSQGGVDINRADLVGKLKTMYAFLVDGSKAEGGISQGNKGQGAQTSNPFKKGETFNLTKQAELLRDNPELAKSLKAQA